MYNSDNFFAAAVNYVSKKINNSDNVYLCPAGEMSLEVFRCLSINGFKISGYFDSSPKQNELDGVPVFSIDNVTSIKPKLVIICHDKHDSDIRNHINLNSWGGEVISFMDVVNENVLSSIRIKDKNTLVKRNICVVETLYTLLLYMLYNKDWKRNTDFYCGELFPEDVRKRLNATRILYPRSMQDRISYAHRLELINKIVTAENVYGQDHLPISNWFLIRDFIVLEDGLANYVEEEIIKYNIGMHKKVKKIILTGLKNIPELIKEKVELVNTEDLLELLDASDKKSILDVFGIDFKKINICDDAILVLTQPFVELNKITTNEQLDIYSSIIIECQKKYSGSLIIIKPHPMDNCDYSSLGCIVFPKNFPIELMNLSNNKIAKSISIFSSASLSLKFVSEIEILGTLKYPKLMEIYGEYAVEHIVNL